MKKSLHQVVFQRNGTSYNPSLLTPGEEIRHMDAILGITSILLKNIELRLCPQCKNTRKVLVETACQKEKGFVQVDFEFAEWLFQDSEAFNYLAKKAHIDMGHEIVIFCAGSTIYRAGIATKKPFIFYDPSKSELFVDVVGKKFCGKLPPVYQLMYRKPNMPYLFPTLVN